MKSTSVPPRKSEDRQGALGDSVDEPRRLLVKNAQEAKQPTSKIPELEKAVAAFERVTQVIRRTRKLAKTRRGRAKMLAEQLRDQAREFRAKADEITDPKKEKEQDKLNVAANENYQKARENAPADKALEKEQDEFRKQASNALTDKAEQKMERAMQLPEKARTK